MKKIYITSLHLQHGGVQFIISQSANAFAELGYDVTILCTYKLGEPAFFISDKVKIDYLTFYKPNRDEFKSALKRFRLHKVLMEGVRAVRILRAKKKVLIDAFKSISEGIIISTRNEDTVLLAKYGHPAVLKIAQIHHDVVPGDKVSKDIRNRYNGIDYLAVLTDEVKRDMENLVLPEDSKIKCVTIENFIVPIDIEKPISRSKTIISVGRLHPDKGYHRLLRIFKEIHHRYPEWMLQIVGDGSLRESLEDMAEKLEISSHVDFIGFLNNSQMRRKMNEASIFAMTSIHEGFGIVLVEAMDSGLPVVSFDVRVGPRSIITHGLNGFLIKDDDYEQYIDHICNLIENTELREKLAENAEIRARDFYKSKIIEKWVSIFEANI